MKAEEISCWKCGTPLPADFPLPLSRRSKCRQCNADLHVCRQCRFYDTSKNNSCAEPMAERVVNKEKANFCDYFEPGTAAFQSNDKTESDASREKLDALFGIESRSSDLNSMGGEILSEEEASREKLNELFGLDKDKKK
jgi:hypothetical protein